MQSKQQRLLVEEPSADEELALAEFWRSRLQLHAFEIAWLVLLAAVHLSLGAVTYMLVEKWTLGSSIYFSIVTLATVGYGDLAPTLPGTKVFTIVYILIAVFFVLGHITGLLESFQQTQEKLLGMKEELESLRRERRRTQYGTGHGPATPPPLNEPVSAWRFYIVNLGLWTAVMVTWLCASAAFFCAAEGPKLGYLDALFFAVITLTTVGYGASEISTPAAHGWCSAFILISLILVTAATANFSAMRTRRNWELHRYVVASQKSNATMLDAALLRKLEVYAGEDKDIDRLTFLTAMLAHLEIAPRTDIQLLMEYFEVLDKDGSGTLSLRELKEEHQRVSRSTQQLQLA